MIAKITADNLKKKGASHPPHPGPIDQIILATSTDTLMVVFKEEQMNFVDENSAFQTVKNVIKNLEIPHTNVKAFTWGAKIAVKPWVQVDSDGNAGTLRLDAFLKHPEIVATYTNQALVRSLTFRETMNGPNISREQAIANNAAFDPDEEPVMNEDNEELPELPSLPCPSEASSSDSPQVASPATPAHKSPGSRKKAKKSSP